MRELRSDLLEKAKKELNEDPARREADIAHIREWLKKQPHIKANPDDQTLIAFLRGCKFSLERVKEKLDLYYTIRTALPEFFKDRDLKHKSIKTIVDSQTFFPLPGLDDNGHRVVLVRPGAVNASTFILQDYLKFMFMVTDVLLREDDDVMVNGLVTVIDVTGVSLNLVSQFSPSLGKKTFICKQDAYPVRNVGQNYIHVPSFVTPFMGPLKSLLNEELYIHGENLESLYKNIPKKILPLEYGGEAGTIKELNDEWLKIFEKYTNWFLEDAKTGVDENKRPGKPKTQQDLFGVEGSFRKLDID